LVLDLSNLLLIKEIGARIKISGPQWNVESVYQILSLPCACLNGLLPILVFLPKLDPPKKFWGESIRGINQP
jgi:hypothetical protein